jgi:hypothetical protein
VCPRRRARVPGTSRRARSLAKHAGAHDADARGEVRRSILGELEDEHED